MIQISDGELWVWQFDAYLALSDILTKGRASGLAPLHWQIGTARGITGTVPVFGNGGAPGVRVLFAAWAGLLGLEVRPEHRRLTGHVELTAELVDETRPVIRLEATIFEPMKDPDHD